MIRLLLRMLPVLTLLIPALGFGASWSVGAHMGASTVFSDVRGSGRTTVVAWPSSVLAYQPGFRIGLADGRHAHNLVLDSGMLNLDMGGSGLSLLSVALGYEHTFVSVRTIAPFATIGVGFHREGSDAATSTSPNFGGGIGLRRRIRGDNGVLRAEVRADYLRASDAFGRPQLTTVGLRVGFDLWL